MVTRGRKDNDEKVTVDGCGARDRGRGRSLGRFLLYVLRHLRRVPMVQHAVPVIGKMWPVAIVLIAVLLFYWFSFCITVIAWLKAISHLCFGNFIWGSIWLSVGCGMLFWWFDKDIDFDTWLRGSAVIVGIGALGTFARFYHRQQRAVQAATPSETTPMRVELLNINIELSGDRPVRGAIGTEQGPRRIPGPTIIDQ